MQIKILHLTYDSVFSARMVSDFEKVSPNNNFLIVPARENPPKHFHKFKNLATPVNDNEVEIELKRHLEFCNLIIIHYMHEDWASFLSNYDTKNTVIFWSGFGGDYYGSAFNGHSKLLGKKTQKKMREIKEPENLKLWLYRKKRLLKFELATQRLAKKVDYFSAPVPNDFEVFKKRFKGFSGAYHQLKYAKSNDFDILRPAKQARNVLVGNSATPENNHLEVFELIKRSNFEHEKIIVPLSYGDTGAYRDEVLAAGAASFGEAFMPLTEFMELNEYNTILSSCGIAIMGHLRQQALGNILTLVASGSNLYLNTSNPIFTYFKEIGLNVEGFSYANIDRLEINNSLTTEDKVRNREIIFDVWSEAKVIGPIEDLLDKVGERFS